MTQDEFAKLVADLFEVMYDHAGQGFAAMQTGLPYSLFVINREGKTWVFINPEVLDYGRRTAVQEEGCLSIPGIVAPVVRPGNVKIRYFDSYDAWQRGKYTTQQYAGPLSRVIQHEYDHLQGILFTDRLSAEELVKVQPKLDNLTKDCHVEQPAPSGLPLLMRPVKAGEPVHATD